MALRGSVSMRQARDNMYSRVTDVSEPFCLCLSVADVGFNDTELRVSSSSSFTTTSVCETGVSIAELAGVDLLEFCCGTRQVSQTVR